MLRRVRTPLLLAILLLALLSGSYWLWHGLRNSGRSDDSGSPTSDSARHAVELLSKEPPPGDAQPPLPPEGKHSERAKVSRDSTGRAPAFDPDATASISGQILDPEGRPVPGTRILLARWTEDESASTEPSFLDDPAVAEFLHAAGRARLAAQSVARIPARIAVHLPIDLADPASVGLPVPLCVQPDEAGSFRIPLPPGRWRLLVRSTLAPYERNDLLLAANEQRELAPIVLRPGITYRFQLKDARGAKAADIRAAPLLSGLGADFPPLLGALALPFLKAPPENDEPQLSLPQRPVPLSLWLAGPHTRALRLELDPANAALSLALPDADHLHGAVQYPAASAEGAFTVHARPLDYFESPIPDEFRADLAHAGEQQHAFDLELPERGTLYEIQAAFGDEPPLLPSPWSPPRYALSDLGGDPRPQHDELHEPLVWLADAELRFELALPDLPLPASPAELFLPGVFVRGAIPGESIELPENAQLLGGLRLLRSPAPQFLLRRPGSEPFSQSLALVAGGTCELGRLALTALPAFRVQVTDASTTKPIARATVSAFEELSGFGLLEPSGPLVLTDERGEAQAFAAQIDFSQFEIRAPNYAPAFVPARMRAPDGSLPVRLYRGATVLVRVFDSDAAPLRAAAVECTRADWTPDLGPPALLETQSTDVQGCATFLHVTPGKHSFRIRSSRKLQPSEWTIVELADNSTRELSLATRARARLKVRVTDSSFPRANALLTLESTTLDLSAHPLPADDPLPYGIDAYTDTRGEALFDDLDPERARLTLTLPGSPVRLRRSLRLHPGAQSFTFDLSDTHLTLANTPATATSLDLYLLPDPTQLQLDDDPIPLASLDLEHTSRLDRRAGRPDLTLSLSGPLTLPSDLLSSTLLLTTPALACAINPHSSLDSANSTPALTPTSTLELTLLSLHPGDRYVVVLGRTLGSQVRAFLDTHPDIRAQLSPNDLASLTSSDTLFLERTLPFIASAPSLTFSLTHLFPGESLLRLYRLAPNPTLLLPDSTPQSVTLSADTPARLQLTTLN